MSLAFPAGSPPAPDVCRRSAVPQAARALPRSVQSSTVFHRPSTVTDTGTGYTMRLLVLARSIERMDSQKASLDGCSCLLHVEAYAGQAPPWPKTCPSLPLFRNHHFTANNSVGMGYIGV